MTSLYLWPDNPALSLFVLWVASVLFLWAAREPMLQLMRGLGKSIEGGLAMAADWCAETAADLRKRSQDALIAAGRVELERRVNRELHRVDTHFSEKLGQYSSLHRRLDDLIREVDNDYQQCGNTPPEIPGWAPAVEAAAGIPNVGGDSNVQKILEGIRNSVHEAEKKSLQQYRTDTAKRHDLLGRMRSQWREIKVLMSRMQDLVSKALQTAVKIDGYVDEYQAMLRDEDSAARALSISAMKPFLISLMVLAVALGGAYINFQLIALPMSELVPAGARLGGVPVSTVSALVIVLMEAAVGIFLMDMLGITDLFPKLATIPASRRRLILGLSVTGLFFLAAVESSLAILREQIVEADAALKLSLADPQSGAIVQPANSAIPVIGQAALGFILPWILAMVAIPLEMLLDSGRHVFAGLVVLVLSAIGHLTGIVAHAVRAVTLTAPNFYDVYVAIPLRVERMLRRDGGADPVLAPGRAKGEGAA